MSINSSDASRNTRNARHDDDDADGEPAVVIGGKKPAAVVDRERNGGQRHDGGEDVNGVVPGIGDQ